MKHPTWKVLEWQRELERDPKLTKVEIAQREGLSKSRITQMFRLLNLPEEALSYLKAQNNYQIIQTHSVRRLVEIIQMQTSEMSKAFKNLRAVRDMSIQKD